jgi:hypothetical protein
MGILICIIANQILFPLVALFCGADFDMPQQAHPPSGSAAAAAAAAVPTEATSTAIDRFSTLARFYTIFGGIMANRLWVCVLAVDLLRTTTKNGNETGGARSSFSAQRTGSFSAHKSAFASQHLLSSNTPVLGYIVGWVCPLGICFLLSMFTAEHGGGCWYRYGRPQMSCATAVVAVSAVVCIIAYLRKPDGVGGGDTGYDVNGSSCSRHEGSLTELLLAEPLEGGGGQIGRLGVIGEGGERLEGAEGEQARGLLVGGDGDGRYLGIEYGASVGGGVGDGGGGDEVKRREQSRKNTQKNESPYIGSSNKRTGWMGSWKSSPSLRGRALVQDIRERLWYVVCSLSCFLSLSFFLALSCFLALMLSLSLSLS